MLCAPENSIFSYYSNIPTHNHFSSFHSVIFLNFFWSSQLFSIVAQVVYFTCQIFLSFFLDSLVKIKWWSPRVERRGGETNYSEKTLHWTNKEKRKKGLSRQWPLVMTMIRKFLQLTHPYFSRVLVHNIYFSLSYMFVYLFPFV